MLKYAFADCPQLFETINDASLESKSLVNITKKYHNYVCDGEKCIIYEKKLPTIKLTWAPFASMNASCLDIANARYQYEHMKSENSIYPSIWVLLNTTMPRANEKLSFQVSAEVGKNYFYGTGTYTYYNSFNEVHLHSTILKCKGGIKYTYPTGKIRPTFMAGVHMAALIDRKGRRLEERNESGTIRSFEYADDVLVDKNFGLNLDLGIDFHEFDSLIPFVCISISSSSGEKRELPAPSYTNTKLKTIAVSAGVYFYFYL